MKQFRISLLLLLQLSITWNRANSLNQTAVEGVENKSTNATIIRSKEEIKISKARSTVFPDSEQTKTSRKNSTPSLPTLAAPKTTRATSTTVSNMAKTNENLFTTAEPTRFVENASTSPRSAEEVRLAKKPGKDEGEKVKGKGERSEGGGIKFFKDKPANKTEPKIMEITTKITDSIGEKQEGGIYGPRIDGIEARFEPVKHAIPAKLKEKLDALSCDVPPLPSESTLWNGNQTRDLSLPITVSGSTRLTLS